MQANESIKYTTDLSTSMSVSKRLGIDHLLDPNSYKKPVSTKAYISHDSSKLDFKPKTVEKHTPKQNESTFFKSHITSSSINRKIRNKSPKLGSKSEKQRPQSVQVTKPNKKSKLYLYKRLSTEVDNIVDEIKADSGEESKILIKDHLRVVLVKTGFIGNNIGDIKEIEQDEQMLDKIWGILRGPENTSIKPNNVKIFTGTILGLKEPIAKKNTPDNNNPSLFSSRLENMPVEKIGFLNENGDFRLRNEHEKRKLMKAFNRLSQNRQVFLHEQIKEKQLKKIKPSETFMPKINHKSELIEKKRMNGHKIPRYQVLLDKGKLMMNEMFVYRNDV